MGYGVKVVEADSPGFSGSAADTKAEKEAALMKGEGGPEGREERNNPAGCTEAAYSTLYQR